MYSLRAGTSSALRAPSPKGKAYFVCGRECGGRQIAAPTNADAQTQRPNHADVGADIIRPGFRLRGGTSSVTAEAVPTCACGFGVSPACFRHRRRLDSTFPSQGKALPSADGTLLPPSCGWSPSLKEGGLKRLYQDEALFL